MSKKTEKILAKARTRLLLSKPFFSQVILTTKYRITNEVDTMATDGKWILINPSFTESITCEEVMGVLAHEALHIIGMHHLRMSIRDHNIWNIACDYAINPLLITDGFQLPSGALLSTKYSDMSAEQIYSLLPEAEEVTTLGSVCPDGSFGENGVPGSSPGITENTDTHEEESRIKRLATQALQSAKMQGIVPGHLLRLVESILTVVTPWKHLLRKYMTKPCNNDYSWSAPNRRYISSGMYLPSMTSDDGMGDVVIAIDLSGSITNSILAVFAANIKQIVTDTRPNSITILYFDTQVTKHVVYTDPVSTDITITAMGGGGTNFCCIFDWIQTNRPFLDVLVVLTDLYGSLPKHMPCDTIWACVPHSSPHTPFGVRVNIKME